MTVNYFNTIYLKFHSGKVLTINSAVKYKIASLRTVY